MNALLKWIMEPTVIYNARHTIWQNSLNFTEVVPIPLLPSNKFEQNDVLTTGQKVNVYSNKTDVLDYRVN